MSIRFQGGCACGAVHYESSAEPRFSFHCQCRQCQRSTGTGHASLLAVAAEALSVRGKLSSTIKKRTAEIPPAAASVRRAVIRS